MTGFEIQDSLSPSRLLWQLIMIKGKDVKRGSKRLSEMRDGSFSLFSVGTAPPPTLRDSAASWRHPPGFRRNSFPDSTSARRVPRQILSPPVHTHSAVIPRVFRRGTLDFSPSSPYFVRNSVVLSRSGQRYFPVPPPLRLHHSALVILPQFADIPPRLDCAFTAASAISPHPRRTPPASLHRSAPATSPFIGQWFISPLFCEENDQKTIILSKCLMVEVIYHGESELPAESPGRDL
jgi:hypothetical protein